MEKGMGAAYYKKLPLLDQFFLRAKTFAEKYLLSLTPLPQENGRE